MAVEIEMRARFTKEAHDQLVTRLKADGEDLGTDDKHIYFYVLPDQLLKVTDNTAAGTAKITLKGSKIGQGAAFPETEFAIAPADVPAAVKVFNALGFETAMHEAFNFRHNFRFGSVEIAVKWSEAWGYHAEFEVLLEDDAPDAARDEAAATITDVATALGVTLMTEQELADFTAAFEAAEKERKEREQQATPIR
ncbi:CYTH domain-containing protein [Streptomyces sp. NP-1717]|uniref:CYTH domain-containing protein n=1 Tax=Streptomyces sp. NP-1717 TaxID=2704470 RepID=UPI001F5D10DE|nr:CYTH domain-containing protein [Streptomyces sp. NP-1717]MCI3224348.1 CYTH domain-containing protein [Streptomyces sp. NP-1717]